MNKALYVILGLALLATGCVQNKTTDVTKRLNDLAAEVTQLNATVSQLSERITKIEGSAPIKLADVSHKSGLSVFIEQEEEVQRLILKTKSGQTVIDETSERPDKPVLSRSLVSPQFSPDGQFIYYVKTGWEHSETNVYDVKQNKIVLTLDTPETFEFTPPDDQLLFACANNEFAGIFYGYIYSIHNLASPLYKLDLPTITVGSFDIACSYVAGESSVIRFTITHYDVPGGSPKKTDRVDYVISTGKAVKTEVPM